MELLNLRVQLATALEWSRPGSPAEVLTALLFVIISLWVCQFISYC